MNNSLITISWIHLLFTSTSAALAAPTVESIEEELIHRAQLADAGAQLEERTAPESVMTLTDAAIGECLESAPLADNPNIDERLSWLSSIEDCLEYIQQMLEAKLYTTRNDEERVSTIRSLAMIKTFANSTASAGADTSGQNDFLGMKWGIGVGYSHAADDIVDNAALVDGRIRVTKDLRTQPRIILEFHRYIGCYTRRGKDVIIETGCGPFAAVVSRDDKALSGVAFGGMYGWRTSKGTDTEGFSIGLGLLLDSEGKTLASGFDEGQPLPDDATQIVFEDEARWSAVLFFTRTF